MSQIVVLVAYLAAAKIGLHFATLHGTVSPFWPPSGLALGVVVLCGSRMGLAIFIGALLTNCWLSPLPIGMAALIGLGNTLEALAGGWLFYRIRRIDSLQNFADSLAWITAALLPPVLSAGVGVGTLYLNGAISLEVSGKLLLTWWLGDCIGILTLAPLIRTLLTDHTLRRRIQLKDLLKAAGLVLAVTLVALGVLNRSSGGAYLFLMFPLLLVAAIWFGALGSQLMGAVIAFIAVLVLNDENAPFVAAHFNTVQLQLMGFLAALALTSQVTTVMARDHCVRLPAIILLGGWLVGGWIFAQVDHERRKVEQIRFSALIDEAADEISRRLGIYIDALWGGVSLFASSEEVTRDEWQRYVASLDLQNRYPGIFGLGVIFPLRANEVGEFEERMRADGRPDFQIHAVPGAKRPQRDNGGWDHFVITYIEPEAVNKAAVGLDLASETNRMVAARTARDYGVPRVTERITLVQWGGKPGFLLYVPMYYSVNPPRTVHERRQWFRGWIYAPFITEEFLMGAVGKLKDQINLSFYEGLEIRDDKLLFQMGKQNSQSYREITRLDLGGRSFTCGWKPGPEFFQFRPEPVMNAISLAIVPALLAGLVVSLQTLGRRASELADERTRELQEVNERLKVEMQERRVAEQRAKEDRKMAERASAAKSEFLATMSHEIRTPMNGIIGYTDLLAQSMQTEEQRSWIRIIQNSGHALLTIINDILDFSKIEAGLMQLERIPFSPADCALEVVEIQRIQADMKRLELKLESGADVPARISGDPTRFRQILLNLVSNALKFTERGSVCIRLLRKGSVAAPRLRVEVQDTGIGIPKDKLGLLFHRFNQVDSSTTRRYGGTGLGLAICKHLVKLMGGKIGVTSEVGEGTLFWFELPVVICPDEIPVAKSRRQSEMEKSAVGIGKRVLVAEDVPINQKLAIVLLDRLGCRIEVAENGRKAAEMALANAYDLIYMDCLMPEWDGFQATQRIRQEERGRRTPIVALTASALEGDRDKCLKAGMDDYMTKPLTRSDFIRTLERWTRRPPAP